MLDDMGSTDHYTTDNTKNIHPFDVNYKRNKNIQYLNHGEEDEMEIYGYTKCKSRTFVTWIFYILTLGLLRLVFHWFSHWMIYATHRKCNLQNAEKVLVVENFMGKHKSFYVKDIKTLSTEGLREIQLKETQSDIPKLYENKLLNIYLENGSQKDLSEMRIIRIKKICYVWDPDMKQFLKLVGLDKHVPNSVLHSFKGFTTEEQSIRRIAYGYNLIDVPLKDISTLLFLEVLNPLYIFQVFTLIVWMLEGYYYYNIAIICLSVFGIGSSVIQTRQNQKNLHGTVHSVDTVMVSRGESIFENVPSSELVPGDIINIPLRKSLLHCDCVLLGGGTCIVNESMLTGESVPVTKTPLPNSSKLIYSVKEDSNHTLYCGTEVIQSRSSGDEPIRAVVIRTGYLTTKGQLVRSILYPPPADFKFEQDIYKFFFLLGIISIIGFIYTIVSKSSRGITVLDMTIKALDLITIAVPPALPAAMTVGKLFALQRLEKKQIFCMNSRIINISGSINCICFDKTGTLTEDDLDMWGVVPVQQNKENGTASQKLAEPVNNIGDLNVTDYLLCGMATCHSLNQIDGNITGDPLDLKMFQSTSWLLNEDIVRPHHKFSTDISQEMHEIKIVKQYQFSSNLQRMSVLTNILPQNNFIVFCKGSPEMIASLSNPSTVPDGLMDSLKVYTEKGYRVIAIGMREFKKDFNTINRLDRDEVESNLIFTGLIIFENRLKPQTTGVIDILKRANMKIVMITGDNIQTALSVAKECGIIATGAKVIDISVAEQKSRLLNGSIVDKVRENNISSCTLRNIENNLESVNSTYAVTGQTWAVVKEHFPKLLVKLVENGVVFARMSSQQKQQLVQELKSLGYYVAMCGDGANDCGALKAAHAGISLSEAESSVASPFTSKENNISCVPKIIREGRAALVTSFGIFKFMVTYSLCEFASVIILYTIDSNLSDMQFLFIDICLVINFAFFFGRTKAYKGPLVGLSPETRLINPVPLLSLVFHIIIQIVFQIIAFHVVKKFVWFEPFVYKASVGSYACHQNFAVWAVSVFQYITMAIVFSEGKPFRQPFYTNIPLTITLLLTTLCCAYMVIYPAEWIIKIMEFKIPPATDFALTAFGLAFANFFVCLLFEDFIVNFIVKKKVLPSIYRHNNVNNNNDAMCPELNCKPTKLNKFGTGNIMFVDDEKIINDPISTQF